LAERSESTLTHTSGSLARERQQRNGQGNHNKSRNTGAGIQDQQTNGGEKATKGENVLA